MTRRAVPVLCLIVPFVLAMAVARMVGGDERPNFGEVVRLVGTGNIIRASDVLPLAIGVALYQDDRLTTDADSRVEIKAVDGSILVIGGSSRVSLANFDTAAAEGGAAALIELFEGILRIDLSDDSAWDRFEVRTNTAIASVRSTQWIVEALPAKSAVFVVDGIVTVTDRIGRGAVELMAGDGTDIPFGAQPGAPKKWGKRRVAAALARTTIE